MPRTPEDIFTQLAHAPHLLELGDMRGRIESATGCMQKNPYVDDRLLELVARIPPDVMLHQNRLRGLFRFAFRRVLPESLRLRTDKARFEPAVREMLGAVGGLESFRDLASMETLGARGIVEPARYRAGFDVLARSSGTYESEGRDWARFWPPLAVEAFARAHRDVAGAARGRP